MYQPKTLELINFGSHKHTVFNFPEHQTVLIQGKNDTNQGQKSNGSGKSFLIEGLSYALLGSSLRNIKDKELVMDGEKDSKIILKLHNPVLKTNLNITRKIYSNTKSGELAIEGEENITSVNEGNKLILDRLGLSREDILNYFLLSKERYKSFFNSSDTDKKDLINRFSKADRIDIAIESCEMDVKDFQIKVQAHSNKIEANKSVIITLQESRENKNVESIKSLKEENRLLEEQIKTIDVGLTKNEYLKQRFQKSVEQNDNLVKSVNISEINHSIKEYELFIDEIERHLNNEITCPKCNHHFSIKDDKYNIEEAKAILPRIIESLSDLKAERDLKKYDLEQFEKELFKSKNDLQDCEMKIKRLSNDKSIQEKLIVNNNSQIEYLSKAIDNSIEIQRLLTNNEKLEKELFEYKNNLQIATESHLRFKRFKGYVANKSLANIQSHVNFFLEKLNSDLQIQIEGYTPINNGKEFREKINTRVFRNIQEASFNRFSGGERSRIEVAVILAMQQIINNVSEGKGLQLLVLDEIVESIDSEGLISLLKSMNQLNQTVLLITHATIEQNYQNVVTIVKKDNISYIL